MSRRKTTPTTNIYGNGGKVSESQQPIRLMRGAFRSTPEELAAAPRLPRQIFEATPPPEFIRLPQRLSRWGNFDYGDCVTAEEAFAKACERPEIFIPDETVVAWARDNGVINGAKLVVVLEKMKSRGFQTDKTYSDGEHYTVEFSDHRLLASAISEGPVKLGVSADQLEATIRQFGPEKNGWCATGYTPDTSLDHCVSLCGYGTLSWLAEKLNANLPSGVDGTLLGYGIFTWDSVGIIDRQSMINISTEAWLRRPTTVTT